MSIQLNASVTWVGKKDWELREFHGVEYSTHRGSSYNSYLVRDEKVALIDTVWQPFAKEFVANLKKEIDLNEIDYIIANHSEIDHSGALPELMREIPNTPIYCTRNGARALKGHYHQNWNFVEVKTGDRLSLGKKELLFIEARMLHWPDSMFCYLTEDNILFSNDAFGQHYATEFLFNDEVDQAELYQEAVKYYANILTPFSSLVEKKINEFIGLNLPLSMICTSHGILWRDNPVQIVEQYMKWAQDYQEDQITLIYDTMWNGTRRMAEAIASGIKMVSPETAVKLFNVGRSDKNDVITEVFKSKAILVGSPTINRGILTSIAAILEEIRGLEFRNKKAAAFGCYGWSGESVKMIGRLLTECGMELMDDGIRALWNPDEDSIAQCVEFGKQIAAAAR
ncbi:MAG: anaerobic nitric oxide reductase flavorubredoxin [Caldicoprobacterales bacterium]|jgi:anaerobic nitric oxide reductase flavorubredoxin|nr:anaerobic nitric oxide reductase flavorubredoxin [Clostridiales bacterium]